MTTKKAPTKAEQAKLDAEKAEAEKAEKAKLEAQKAEAEQAEADAKAKAEKEARAKADQAKIDAEKAEAEKAEQAKLDAEKVAQAEPVALKPWNGDPLTPAPEEKTYRARWTLHHDNKRYAEGDTLTLSDDDAAPLIEAGVLVAVK